jgi:MscS family membrane protein
MKIGEWIKVGNIEGIVEDIGIRTTKIRTFEKGLITVPNSYIANNPLENFSRRNVRRVKMKIGVVYSTSKENLQKIVEEIRNLINTHPKVAKDQTIAIYFDEFGDSSLNIFIYFYTNTANWLEWFEIKEEIQYKIIDIVERNGSSFAFPSRSIYIEEIPQEVKN